MFKNKHLVIYIVLICFMGSVAGCKSKFDKLLASNATSKKNQEALRLYNKKDYTKAAILFENLMSKYKGMPEAEDLAYHYAYTNYYLRDYITARYQFKIFADTYPYSDKAEEARYMSAYCFYLDSPNETLDQTNTVKAIDALQLFINLYPKGERVTEATKLIEDLRSKLETKSFLNAKLYLDIGATDITYYRAAVIAFKNSLRDYPDSKYAEEIEFLSIKAQYLYAKNSLEARQPERYTEAVALYNEFILEYPKSKFLSEATDLKKSSERGIVEAKKILASQQVVKKDEDVKPEVK